MSIPAGRKHFHCWWLWDVREPILPILDIAQGDETKTKNPVKMDRSKQTLGNFYCCEISNVFNTLSLLAMGSPMI